MKGSDKLLILIVGIVIVVVIVAFSLVLLRPEPEYQTDNAPENVVHNYLLALRQEDFELAYSYISENAKVEDLDDFIDSVENRWTFDLGSNVALSVEETMMSGESSARVKVQKTRTNNDIFGGSQYSDSFTVRLEKEGEEWKITDSDEYWDYCWDKGSSCR